MKNYLQWQKVQNFYREGDRLYSLIMNSEFVKDDNKKIEFIKEILLQATGNWDDDLEAMGNFSENITEVFEQD